MPKKYIVDGVEVELDNDVEATDLEPTPDNALTDEQLAAIQAQEQAEVDHDETADQQEPEVYGE